MGTYQDASGTGVQPVIQVGTTKTITVNPTTDTAIYASGDTLGSLMTFAGVARFNGGSAVVQAMTIVDAAAQNANLELWLFTGTVTASADNAAWSISDADALKCVGVIPTSGVNYASALNSVSSKLSINLPVTCASDSTSLYGQLVSRGTPTYGASSLTVKLTVVQD